MKERMTGKISIFRVHGGSDETRASPIRIEITDEISGITFLEVRMSLEGFANALMSHSYENCGFTLRAQNVGKKRELKEEKVPISKEDRYTRGNQESEVAKRILAPYEVDGWMARESDLFNHHRRNQDDTQTVSFHRFVEIPDSRPSTPDPVSSPSEADKRATAAPQQAKEGIL